MSRRAERAAIFRSAQKTDDRAGQEAETNNHSKMRCEENCGKTRMKEGHKQKSKRTSE